MRGVHVLPAVCSAVLVLLFVETGCGQTASQEQVLSFLDELDKLAEPKSVQGNKEHFCKFFEPHLIRMSQHYKRRTVKNVQIPCAKDNSMTRCNNSRVVFEPAVREVTKKVLRRVQRCCKGWKGIRCDERDKDDSLNDKRQLSDSSSAKTCSPSCQNNGLCSNGLCFCSPGYTGRACERAVCIPNCLNGGLCVKPNQCACPNGWTGTRCSKALCTISCQNGGSCVAPNKCQCRLGYSGVTCETDFCETPCHNGGNCVAGNCSCASGWSGNRCQTPRCVAGCANQGTCIAPEVCACAPGYTGSQCQFRMGTFIYRKEYTCYKSSLSTITFTIEEPLVFRF